MRIAAAVILYYPDNEIVQRIQSYLNEVTTLYILDNSENNTGHKALLKTLDTDKVVYLHDGENKGISIRLNQAAILAAEQQAEWLLTMDQDSYFPANIVAQYFNCLENSLSKENTAMFGVQFLNAPLHADCAFVEAKHLITSGSIVNLNIFQIIGGFDEALFIDKVDHEYCLRARALNYKVIEFSNIFLHHHLGNVTYGRSLKNFQLTPRVLHSPIRMYYIMRNYLYLKDKYKGQFTDSFEEMRKEIWNRTKNNFLYGKNKWAVIKYLLKGYQDYSAGKMGKIIN